MHDDHELIEQRLRRTLGRIRPAVYSERVDLDVAAWAAPDEPVPVADGLRAPYVAARVGDRWGPPWNTTWFRVTGAVPQGWAGRTVEAVIDIGFDADRTGFHAEGLVYRSDGSPVKGLNPRTQWVRVAEPAHGGEPVELYIEAAANPSILAEDDFLPTPLGDRATAGNDGHVAVEPPLCAPHEFLDLRHLEGWRLAGGPGHHDAIRAFGRVEIQQPVPGLEIERTVGTHGRDQCRDTALEHLAPRSVDYACY